MSSDGIALRVEGLSAGYGKFDVLHDLSFSVDRGKIVTLLGANGAGKTTTLRAISGAIRYSGKVYFDDVASSRLRPPDLVRRGLAHIPQGRGTFPNLTVEENLRVGAAARRDVHVVEDMEVWYATFPRLHERRKERGGNLSGGEQQMLAISRAMMSRPRLLLLDEPSMGLAPNITDIVFEQLLEINASYGTSMLIVEQNANMALSIAQSAIVLESGELTLSGSAAELRADDRIRRAYLQV